MSMTNREESEAAEHETYPGPGPLRADESKRGIHPVEQMVDAAIDRIAREREASRAGDGDPGHALALAPKEGAPSALVTTKRGSGKLRWKGLEVSDEFRSYAERVARGEDLPPYKGRILAEPDAAFPWEPAARKRAKRQARRLQTALWGAGAALVGLASWSLVVQLGGEADAWQRAGESALATAVLSNQPNTERTASEEVAPELPAAPATSPLQVSDGAEPASAAPAGSTALVALTAPAHPTTPSASTSGAGVRSPQPASEPAKPVATRDSVGVFVTTRAQSNEVPSTAASPVTNAASAAAVSPASPSAAARSPADNSLGASSTAVAPSAAIAQADPKKEPSAEPSANGALLVETPSF